MTALIIILVAALGLIIGYSTRELRETLKRIEAALKVLVQRKDKVEAEESKPKKMGFGDTMSMAELAEMEEEERIETFQNL